MTMIHLLKYSPNVTNFFRFWAGTACFAFWFFGCSQSWRWWWCHFWGFWFRTAHFLGIYWKSNENREINQHILLNCIRKMRITSGIFVQGQLNNVIKNEINAWTIHIKFNRKIKSNIFTMIFCLALLINVYFLTIFTWEMKLLCTTMLL